MWIYSTKRAINVGATSGIGKSLAEILLLEGYVVGVIGRREEFLQLTQEKYLGRAFFKRMDVH